MGLKQKRLGSTGLNDARDEQKHMGKHPVITFFFGVGYKKGQI